MRVSFAGTGAGFDQSTRRFTNLSRSKMDYFNAAVRLNRFDTPSELLSETRKTRVPSDDPAGDFDFGYLRRNSRGLNIFFPFFSSTSPTRSGQNWSGSDAANRPTDSSVTNRTVNSILVREARVLQ